MLLINIETVASELHGIKARHIKVLCLVCDISVEYQIIR